MIIGSICLLIFLFTVYQLSKDDFLFLRKGVTVEHVFNIVFLGLPIAFLSARIVYILLHPSWRYLNPLVFLALPYFPGLSLVGGILGVWLFILFYTKNKKIPSHRLLDMLSLSFLLAMSIGIMLQAIFLIFHSRILGFEEVGRSLLGIILYVVLLFQFIKGKWVEGSLAYFVVVLYCLLAFIYDATNFLLHQSISLSTIIATAILGLGALCLFILKQPLLKGWK